MHSNVNANPYAPAHGHPLAHAHAHGPHPNHLDYAWNDYYYDPAPSAAGYSPAYSYMNFNMGGQDQGDAGAYGGGSASVLEDQLIGTYGDGIHRLESSSLHQGPSPRNYDASSAGGYRVQLLISM
ncbi:hypothetical protein M408DRAFT_334230 [Serendipita vermifera MAFF 305830]|uniref:Uncharacterized protein n=1 Tax=Serendipita vermifera MAFF 305830 TaxID=933852 RepID=A0A0C2WQH5_SERVB|nr:hypothetical protein M408DRAFT_334230 [Serendipita vermifera MAFF 305830]